MTATGGGSIDNLLVSGRLTIDSGVFISGGCFIDNLNVSGRITVDSGLSVIGGGSIDNLTVENNASFKNGMNIGYTKIDSDGNINAKSLFSSNNTILNNLTVSGTVSFPLNSISASSIIGTPIGPQGEQGLQGIQGLQGPTGLQGDQGIQGEQGLQGIQGEQGLQGIQGLQGPTGLQGDQGIQGEQGLQGIQGEQGLQGIQGLQGPTGLQGDQGIQGEQGLQGIQGEQGLQGIQGLQGPTGLQGDKGIQGEQGITGPQGIEGIQGIQGVTGLQGIEGIQGIQGEKGDQGIQGIQGIQGVTGMQGIEGIQGPQGIQGPTGLKGEPGATGSSGESQLGIANTWTAIQIFNQPPVMSGASITASTIPASAIVGGVGGSSALPTDTMTTRTATQIGYQITTNIGGNINANYTSYTLGNLTLSPVGSIWVVSYQINFTNSNSNMTYIEMNCQVGTTWETGSHKYNAGAHVCGLVDFSGLGNGSILLGNYSYPKSYEGSNVYVVGASGQNLCFGIRCSTNTGGNISTTGVLTATRIA